MTFRVMKLDRYVTVVYRGNLCQVSVYRHGHESGLKLNLNWALNLVLSFCGGIGAAEIL